MRFSETALPWGLFCLVTVALVVVLMNLDSFHRSTLQGERWKEATSQAADEAVIRQIFQNKIDELAAELVSAHERIAELESRLANH